LKDIRAEISDLPQESATGDKQVDEMEREKERFEEDSFVRLQETKAYKKEKKKRKLSSHSIIGKLDDSFTDLVTSADRPQHGGDFMGGFVGGRKQKQKKASKKGRRRG